MAPRVASLANWAWLKFETTVAMSAQTSPDSCWLRFTFVLVHISFGQGDLVERVPIEHPLRIELARRALYLVNRLGNVVAAHSLPLLLTLLNSSLSHLRTLQLLSFLSHPLPPDPFKTITSLFFLSHTCFSSTR